MIIPCKVAHRINSVFGPPSSSSPFIKMAGGNDGSGGSDGSREEKRLKLANVESMYIPGGFTTEELKEIRDMSSSDSDDDSDIDDERLPMWSNIDYKVLETIAYSKNDNVDVTIDEERNIMSKFVNAKCIPNEFDPYDDDEKKNIMEYYNKKKPPPVMSIVAQSDNRDSFMSCDRLSSIFEKFDDRKYRKPSNEKDDGGEDEKEDESKPPANKTETREEDSNKKAERIMTDATKPDNVILSQSGVKPAYNTAEDLLMGLCIDHLTDFAGEARALGTSYTYKYKAPVFADDGKTLYLGGVEYEGGGVVFDGEKYVGKKDGDKHVGKEYVGGDRRNVIVMHIISELEKAGVQFLNKEGNSRRGYRVFTLPITNDIKNHSTDNEESQTIRMKIYRKMVTILNDVQGAKSKYRDDHEVKLDKEVKRINGLPTLTGKECISDPNYKPSYTKDPTERRVNHGNVSEEDYQRFERQVKMLRDSQEKEKKAEAAATKPRESKHKTTAEALIGNCNVFEKILEIEVQGEGFSGKEHPTVTYEKLVEELKQYSNIPMEQLCAPETGSMDYESRWKKEWKIMLGQITLSYIKHFCIECYNCPRGVKGVKGVDEVDLWCQLCKLPLDHLIKWFPKWKDLARIAGKGYGPREVIMEALKCRVVCTCCHYHGHEDDIGDYYERLDTPNHLLYSPDIYGDVHRSVTEVLNIREVASTKLDLEERGAFVNPQKGNGTITYKTVQVVVWMHLRIFLPDLRKGDETAYIEKGGKNRLLCTRAFRELIKMLGVKCPGNERESFLNMREPTRSGVELNHKNRSKKSATPSDLFKYANLTRLIHEANVCKLHPISTGKHGDVTAYQYGKIEKPDWYEEEK